MGISVQLLSADNALKTKIEKFDGVVMLVYCAFMRLFPNQSFCDYLKLNNYIGGFYCENTCYRL